MVMNSQHIYCMNSSAASVYLPLNSLYVETSVSKARCQRRHLLGAVGGEDTIGVST